MVLLLHLAVVDAGHSPHPSPAPLHLQPFDEQDDGTGPALPTSVTANAGIRDAIARLLQNNASPHSMAGEAAAAQAGQRRRVETTAAQ